MFELIKDLNEELRGKRSGSLFYLWKRSRYSPSDHLIILYRFMVHAYSKGQNRRGFYFRKKIEKRYASYIHPDAKIGKGVQFRHPTGVVIGEGVTIGNQTVIYHQVTLGGKNVGDQKKKHYPTVGERATIFAGAKIVGNISIGDEAVIGANSVVIKDVPSRTTYAGVPAKQISS